MRDPRIARAFFGATSLLVTLGLVLQLWLSLTAPADEGYFASTPDRIINFFSFFTVLSNVAVAVTTGMLAVRLERHSPIFRALRLDGVVAIAVTGVVFHTALADLQELTRWYAVADTILHTVSPIITVLGWLAFGPRRAISPRIVLLAVVPPVLWIVYALVRGALVNDRNGVPYYPYPFMNVGVLGYPTVLLNVSMVAVLFLVISFGALALDRVLPGVHAPPPS